MEGELNLPIDLSKQNHPTIEGFSSQPFQERHIQSSFIWVNPFTHTISGLPDMSLQPFASQQICDVNSFPVYVPQESAAHSDSLQDVLSGPLYDQLGENMVSNNWMSQDYMNLVDQTSNANNELSLRLSAYSRPPSVNEGSSIHNQCSDTSRKSSEFSQILSQPRYLGVIQEILSQFANFSLENMDHQQNTSHLDHCAEQGDSFKDSDESSNLGGVFVEAPPTESYRRRENEAKKSQLLTLLQMLDDCYNQCLDEIHTVISAFHAATELDPHTHASFALRTISILYKSLKERISNQILKMGAYDDVGDASGSCSRDQLERSFEKSFIQKQWALQQLKRKDQQLWRPQRGLPERSVSVLRAWMFQNFLHPYPKDAEKHLLAIKSGLTRSQVSNWFINARVRLWKPLIEEMYAELNRSRAGNGNNQGNEGSNTYNCLSIRNSRYNTS